MFRGEQEKKDQGFCAGVMFILLSPLILSCECLYFALDCHFFFLLEETVSAGYILEYQKVHIYLSNSGAAATHLPKFSPFALVHILF